VTRGHPASGPYRSIADAIGANAELVVLRGAGHSVNLTRTSIVDDALNELLDRVAARPWTAG
jgi:hypothetical protein